MKRFILVLSTVGVMAAAAPAVQAKDGTSYSAALLSNYIFRGLTQTKDGLALQGTAEMAKGDLTLGGFASNVDDAGASAVEVDLYGSYSFGKVAVGGIYYYYTGSNLKAVTEINVSGSISDVDLKASYNPDSANTYTYVEAAYKMGLSKGLNLNLHGGVNSAKTATTTDFLVGVSGEFKKFDWAVAVTNETNAGSKAFASVSKSF